MLCKHAFPCRAQRGLRGDAVGVDTRCAVLLLENPPEVRVVVVAVLGKVAVEEKACGRGGEMNTKKKRGMCASADQRECIPPGLDDYGLGFSAEQPTPAPSFLLPESGAATTVASGKRLEM